MNINKKKVMVLASGGIDSTALIQFYIEQDYSISCLHFQYGQPSAKSELRAVREIIDYYSVPLAILNLNYEFKKRKDEFIGRNALFILMALSFSISEGIKRISIGINKTSHYYDCSDSFIDDIQGIIDGYYSGTHQVEAPFLQLTKYQIMQYCIEKKVPVDLTYSCLRKETIPCGECEACIDRRSINEIKRAL